MTLTVGFVPIIAYVSTCSLEWVSEIHRKVITCPQQGWKRQPNLDSRAWS